MISWKASIEKINSDLELARKRKQVLENLIRSEKISKTTYESLSKEIEEEIMEINARQKALTEKMNMKINELENQIRTLELLLASLEMSYAIGEIDEDLYRKKSSAIETGLETIRSELNFMKEAVASLMGETVGVVEPASTPFEEAQPEPTEEGVIEEAGEETFEEISEKPMDVPSEEGSVEFKTEGVEEAEGTSEQTGEELHITEETEGTVEGAVEGVVEEVTEESTEAIEATVTSVEASGEIEEEASTEESYSYEGGY